MSKQFEPKWDIKGFYSWLRNNAKVNLGNGIKVHFVPNKAQQIILETSDCIKGKEGFCGIVKARQLGITTLLLFFTAYLVFRYPGISIIWITPKMDPVGIEVIFKWRSILDSLRSAPDSGWSKPKSDSKQETSFHNGSRVTWHHIGGSESTADAVGRAGTFALAIMTELAFPTDERLVRRMLDALEPTLRRVKAPVIVDSTPGQLPGTGEAYRDIIMEINDGIRRGEVIHLPWWTYEGYRQEVSDPVAFGKALTPEEIALLKANRLSFHQIAWRREEMRPRLKETDEEANRRFAKKYTETIDDAFIELGEDSLFDASLIASIRGAIRLGDGHDPLTGAEVEALLPDYLKVGAGDLMLRPKTSGTPGEGYVRIFDPPDLTACDGRGSYYVGVDCSDGLPGGDWQVCTLLDRHGNRVAYARCRINQYRWSALVQRMVTWYNASGIIEAQYGRMVDRLIAAPVGEEEISSVQGVRVGELAILRTACRLLVMVATTEVNRRLYFDALFGLLIRLDWQHDKETIQEMTDLIRHNGKLQARPSAGCHDDILLSLGIAENERREAMSRVKRRERDRSRRASRAIGRAGRRKYGYLG